MGLTAASYFSHRQVGGWVELRRISVQRSLRLISLSNYVFVLEISQISGIVQNVSMLIMVVMRIVAVVERRERERRSVTGTKSSPRSKSLYQIQISSNGRCSTQLHPRNSQGNCYFCLWNTWHLPSCAGCTYLCQTTKRSLLIFPACAWAAVVSQHQKCKCLTSGDTFWFSLLARCHNIRHPSSSLPSPVMLSWWSWPPSEDKPLDLLPVTQPFPFLLSGAFFSSFPSIFPSFLLCHSSFSHSFTLSLYLSPSPSPTLGPTVIGIPSGSWDPYKHSRQRERGSEAKCAWERDMEAERKRKPASQYAGSLEHWVTVAAASFVCVCPILCLKQSPPPLSAHTGKPDSNTPQAAWSPVIWVFLHLCVFWHSSLWNNYQINSSELSEARPLSGFS